MNPPVWRSTLFIVGSLFAISSVFAAGTFDPTQFSTGDFHGCPPTGQGGDLYLNSLKNRDDHTKFPSTVRFYTVDQLYRVTPTLPKRRQPRTRWTAQQRGTAAKWESQAVMVEGYLIHVPELEGQETCNCGSGQYRDHHMWLAQNPTDQRSRAMVVEISPRAWPTHPGWNNAVSTLKPVVDAREKVRVTGWLTWDQEHNEQVGSTRRTLWEVHPIHQIQVLRAGHWVSL
jgi:hypothetical protein